MDRANVGVNYHFRSDPVVEVQEMSDDSFAVTIGAEYVNRVVFFVDKEQFQSLRVQLAEELWKVRIDG